jgi:uncharacterized membrane protein YphA (DoxX/SURF4 family)
MDNLWPAAYWVGRVLFSVYFIIAGSMHFGMLSGMTAYAQSKKVPAPQLAVLVTGAMLVFGGASILLNWHPIWGCASLVAFLIPVAVIMHDFWNETDPMMRMNQMAQFGKNVTLAGGAMLYAVMINRVGMAMAM